jgi:hypothetical protein
LRSFRSMAQVLVELRDHLARRRRDALVVISATAFLAELGRATALLC